MQVVQQVKNITAVVTWSCHSGKSALKRALRWAMPEELDDLLIDTLNNLVENDMPSLILYHLQY